jgi:hypothetical protein
LPEEQSDPATLVDVGPHTAPGLSLGAHWPEEQNSVAAQPELSVQVATHR